eukprot:gene1467-1850_t
MLNAKIVVLGAGSVGKSAITIQYVNGEFIDHYDPTIEDMYRKVVEMGKEHYILEIMDTAGTENFLVMRDLYIRNGQGFLLVYSITAKSTYYELEAIKDQICRIKDKPIAQVPIVVIGNKCDLEKDRQVKSDEGEELVKKWGGQCDFMETSAKTNVNINSAFEQVIKQIRSKTPNTKPNKKKSKTNANCLIF